MIRGFVGCMAALALAGCGIQEAKEGLDKQEDLLAKVLWTGIMNADLRGPPTVVEQGREYDLLVRQNGKWLIKKRVVVADSGLPENMVATYDKRENYDITAD